MQATKTAQVPAEPIVMHRNQAEIDKFLNQGNALVKQANQVLAAFRSLDLGELTMHDLHDFTTRSKPVSRLVQERLVKEDVEIGGLVFEAKRAREMVKLPDLSEVEAAVGKLKKTMEQHSAHHYPLATLNSVAIEDGTAVLEEQAVKNFTDSQSMYAQTDIEKDIYQKVQQIKDAMQELSDKHGVHLINRDEQQNVLRQVQNWGGVTPASGYNTTVNPHILKNRMREVQGLNRY